MKKVLFVSTQFLTEKTDHGGIGNYIYKMSKALMERGHAAEVLVTSTENKGTTTFDGIYVHRVYINTFLNRLCKRFGKIPYMKIPSLLAGRAAVAYQVRKKFTGLNRSKSYDIVQVPNYQVPGLFISRSKSHRLYNRISSNRILYDTAENGKVDLAGRLENRLDVLQALKSDVVYAPSRYLANYLRKTHGLDVEVAYPPAELGGIGLEGVEDKLPRKYLIHYGYLSRRKGTDIVAEALKIALDEQPDICMIFAGKMSIKMRYLEMDEFWGDLKKSVHFAGFLEKKRIYSLVAGAHYTVLPSRVDNLPNTVIESLSLGTPVIGSNNSSIEEIVKPGINGMLIENGNIEELAEALKDVWSRRCLCSSRQVKGSLEGFDTEKSVRDFLGYSG